MLHKGHFDASTGVSSLCKICTSKHCDAINKLIVQGLTLKKIQTEISKTDPKFKLSEFSLRRHKKSHILQLILGGKKNSDPTEIQIKNMTEFLDLIIEKVYADLQSGKLVPSISDAVKASEIKSKLKEDNKFTSELKDYFLQVSNVSGYHR
jgi:hypothetical protein